VYKLKISKLYDSDVDSCYDYINDTLKNPTAAYNLISEIKGKLILICENPRIRPLVRDDYLANLGYRLLNIKNYLLFYIIGEDNKHIKIVRFLYGRRDWMNILKGKSVEEMMGED
jgi:plasmid stabilization system protein ParE